MLNHPPADPFFIAPCGIHCGYCLAHLRQKNQCPGCRGPEDQKSVARLRCRIKTCPELALTQSKLCYECSRFPCARLSKLDARYKTKYRLSLTGNLMQIKTLGMDTFLRNEKEKRTCKTCKGPVCIHTGCLNCNK